MNETPNQTTEAAPLETTTDLPMRIKPPRDARLFEAYAAISPRGHVIRTTIRPDADEAWRAMRAAVTEPDALHDRGWGIARLACHYVGEVQ